MNVWMHTDEINAIERNLNPSDCVFEWGAGGSTIHFGKQVSQYISVEHDKTWFNLINQEIINRQLKHKIFLFHCPANSKRTIPTKYEQFENYINFFPDGINQNQFDKVLIDGRARQFCATSALQFIKPDGLLFVHDYFDRPRYFMIEEQWELMESIRHTPQTLAIFRPRGKK